jgi:hypothetical protein
MLEKDLASARLHAAGLFADISGFTVMTETLMRERDGRRRGLIAAAPDFARDRQRPAHAGCRSRAPPVVKHP